MSLMPVAVFCHLNSSNRIMELSAILKVKCDNRSKFSNLSNWKEEAWHFMILLFCFSVDSRSLILNPGFPGDLHYVP